MNIEFNESINSVIQFNMSSDIKSINKYFETNADNFLSFPLAYLYIHLKRDLSRCYEQSMEPQMQLNLSPTNQRS